MARPIIIDADPSPDDAVAFLMALGSPEALEVLAVTTVGGNAPLRLTTENALKALELTGRGDAPVYAGASAPLCRKLATAEHVHARTASRGTTCRNRSWRPPRASRPTRSSTSSCRGPSGPSRCAVSRR